MFSVKSSNKIGEKIEMLTVSHSIGVGMLRCQETYLKEETRGNLDAKQSLTPKGKYVYSNKQ